MSREFCWEWVVLAQPGDDDFMDRLVDAVEDELPRHAFGGGYGNLDTGEHGYLMYGNRAKVRRYVDRLSARLGVIGELAKFRVDAPPVAASVLGSPETTE